MNSSVLQRRVVSLLLIPVLVLLSSCMRYQNDIVIQSEKRVDITLNVGIQKSMATTDATTPEAICEGNTQGLSMNQVIAGWQDVSKEPYDDGAYVGCRISGWIAPGDLSGDIRITKEGKLWRFTMQPTSNGQLTASTMTDFRVSVTFPGEVQSHSGSSTVEGRKVTWTRTSDLSGAGLEATSKVGGWPSWLVPALIGLGVLLAGLVVFLFVRLRRQAPPTGQPVPWTPANGAGPGVPPTSTGASAAWPSDQASPGWTPDQPAQDWSQQNHGYGQYGPGEGLGTGEGDRDTENPWAKPRE